MLIHIFSKATSTLSPSISLLPPALWTVGVLGGNLSGFDRPESFSPSRSLKIVHLSTRGLSAGSLSTCSGTAVKAKRPAHIWSHVHTVTLKKSNNNKKKKSVLANTCRHTCIVESHPGRHLQERCSDIWMCGESDNSDDGDMHIHTHTHTITFSLGIQGRKT